MKGHKMKTNYFMITLSLAAILAFGTIAFAHGPGGGTQGGYGGRIYGMMGGGGGMMSGSGGMNRGLNNWPDMLEQYRKVQPPSGQRYQSSMEEVEALKRKIREKRQELSSLYRSGRADKEQIDRRVDELNDLEDKLDEKLYGRR
jgi:Spy/CpxP family protein refolding chaperone